MSEQVQVYVLTKQPYGMSLQSQTVHSKADVEYLVSRGWTVIAAGSRPAESELDKLV